MKKIIGTLTYLVFALLSAVGFIGCGDNPEGNPVGVSSTSFDSTKASFVLVDSWQKNGAWEYQVRATNFFNPEVADSASMLGIRADSKDWNNWRLGIIGHKVDDNVWEFIVSTSNGPKTVNFCHMDNWAQHSALRNTGYSVSKGGNVDLTIDFEDGKIYKVGGISCGRDTLKIIKTINGKDTLWDTLFRNDTTKLTDTVIVLVGNLVSTLGDPINMGDGSWRNTILFSKLGVVAPDTSYHPFSIGLPPSDWTKVNKRNLTKVTNGYSLVVTLKANQKYKFGFGGDWDKAWAKDSLLLGSYWGVKTPSGVIGELYVDSTGHIFPGSLVSTSVSPSVVIHDTVIRMDTVVHVDTVAGKRITDSVFVYVVVGGKTDTIKVKSDTVALAGDMIKVENIVSVSGGYQVSLAFPSPLIRTVVNGKPFAIGLPNWRVYLLGGKRTDWYYPVVVTLPVGTYEFNAGGDSASSWADSSLIKSSAWGYKTSKGWSFRGTMTSSGKFIPTSLVTPADTITVIQIKVDTLKFVRVDTVYLQGKIIRDTVKYNTVTHDTIRTPPDTLYVSNTIIEKGTVVDSSKSFLRDTTWIDADSLKGIITADTIVSSRAIHNYLIVSARGDTTPKADTSVSNKIYRYSADTVSFVIAQYGGARLVDADTVYRFGITAKAFTYSGKGDDSVTLIGISDTSKWKFVGKIGGYFVFDAKLIGSVTYSLNFVGNKGTWAKHEVLMLSPFAVKSGSNVDLVVKGGGVFGLVKP